MWSFETLDGEGGKPGSSENNMGEYNAAVIYNVRPHVFYYGVAGGNLRHAWYNGSFWSAETLDGAGGSNGRISADVGKYAEAMIYAGRPHVFYQDDDGNDLRHGYYNGQFWAFEVLDGNGGHANGPNGRVLANSGQHPGAITYAGRPHVFYYDDSDLTLRHAWYDGAAWLYEDLDGNGGPNGRIVAEVGISANTPVQYGFALHVFYRDNTGFNLRHAYNTPFGWGFETLDGHQNGLNGSINGGVGIDASAVVVGDRIRVFHWYQGTSDLRHSYYTGSAWGHETLDGHQNGPNGRIMANLGQDNAALNDNGKVRVFSWDLSNSDLRHGWFG